MVSPWGEKKNAKSLLLLDPPPYTHTPDHCFLNIGILGLLNVCSTTSTQPNLNSTSKVFAVLETGDHRIVYTNARLGTKYHLLLLVLMVMNGTE